MWVKRPRKGAKPRRVNAPKKPQDITTHNQYGASLEGMERLGRMVEVEDGVSATKRRRLAPVATVEGEGESSTSQLDPSEGWEDVPYSETVREAPKPRRPKVRSLS